MLLLHKVLNTPPLIITKNTQKVVFLILTSLYEPNVVTPCILAVRENERTKGSSLLLFSFHIIQRLLFCGTNFHQTVLCNWTLFNVFWTSYVRSIYVLCWLGIQVMLSDSISIKPEAVDQRCSIKIGILKNFAKFTGKHLANVSFLVVFVFALKKWVFDLGNEL